MSREKYSEERAEFIETSRDRLLEVAQGVEKAVWILLAASILSKLTESEDGKLKNESTNFEIAQVPLTTETLAATAVLTSFALRSFETLLDLHRKYFQTMRPNSGGTVTTIFNGLITRFGVSSGTILLNSWLYRIAILQRPMELIRQRILEAIATEQSYKVLFKSLQDYVLGEGRRGVIVSFIDGSMGNTFAEFSRTLGAQVAKDIDLKYAVYSGGLAVDSRDFCVFRNGKVFTRDQIEKFGSPEDDWKAYELGNEVDLQGDLIKNGGYTNHSKGEFQGKNTPYNPMISLGGYNCLHDLDWITDDLAELWMKNNGQDATE